MALVVFKEPIAFDWDKGNIGKNFVKHHITDKECEEVFFDPQRKVFEDIKHSGKEKRYLLFGRTESHHYLLVAFTLRDHKARVISARPMNKKERKIYEKAA